MASKLHNYRTSVKQWLVKEHNWTPEAAKTWVTLHPMYIKNMWVIEKPAKSVAELIANM